MVICQTGNPSSIMAQEPSWQLNCVPSQGQASCCSTVTPGVAARHGIVSLSFFFTVVTTGLLLTMLSPVTVRMFLALHGGLDPVAAALSQVGLPTSVYGHFLW